MTLHDTIVALGDSIINLVESKSGGVDITSDLSNKADKSLGNIDTAGQQVITDNVNTNLNQKVTNCILEAPKMISGIEIEENTITVKQGSMAIVPYGTEAPTMEIGDSLNGGTIVDISWDNSKLFYIIKYSQDISKTITSIADKSWSFTNSGALMEATISNTVSSDTQPTTAGCVWYDTTNNEVMRMNASGTGWSHYYSLPFCMVNSEGEIQETFQHIGYIGHHYWVMKGIKYLPAKGKNEDETFVIGEVIVPYVKVGEYTNSATKEMTILLNGSNGGLSATFYDVSLDMEKGELYVANNNSYLNNVCIAGALTATADGFSNLRAKYPICLVDAYDVHGKYLKLTGGTVTGNITRQSSAANSWCSYHGKNTAVDATTDSSSNSLGAQLVSSDKNNKYMGSFDTYISTSGITCTRMGVRSYKTDGTDNGSSYFEIRKDRNGDFSMIANYKTMRYVTDTYMSGTSWWRLWSDGWCEQGGRLASGTVPVMGSFLNRDITLLKGMSNANYNISFAWFGDAGLANQIGVTASAIAASKFTTSMYSNNVYGAISSPVLIWQVSGYIA